MLKLLLCTAANFVIGTTPSVAGKPDANCTCGAWVKKTLASVKKVPIHKARATIITALATACDVIPNELKRASSTRPSSLQPRRLASVSAGILGSACVVSDPLAPATTVSAACELKGFAPSNAAVKSDMRAGDYVMLLALVKLWRDHGISDESSERLFDTFELSAALWGEKLRNAKHAASR